MLRYLASGPRQFGITPMYVHRRANWEFFAVLRGDCGLVLPGGPIPPLRRRHFWVFPPDAAHGWVGRGTQACHVAVFHFATVPDLLERAVRRGGYLSGDLTAAEVPRWLALARELTPHYHQPTQRSRLVFERARLDLSLMAIARVPEERAVLEMEYAPQKVESALAWYDEHMQERPKMEALAAAVHISVRHLRRLFHAVRSESPQAVLSRRRVARAMDLMSQSDAPLAAIAGQCGFASISDFCRVFKISQGISPMAWRRRKV